MPARVEDTGVGCRTLRGEMVDAAIEPKLTATPISGGTRQALPWRKARRLFGRFSRYDLATAGLIAALTVIALCTFRDYAITNDEEVQQRYDLKDSHSNIELIEKDNKIVLTSSDDYKLKAVIETLESKLVKRKVPLKGLSYGAIVPAAP